MKVIEDKYNGPWEREEKCRVCGSILLIEIEDIRNRIDRYVSEVRGNIKSWDEDKFFTIQCPCCGKESKVENLPPNIESRVRKFPPIITEEK